MKQSMIRGIVLLVLGLAFLTACISENAPDRGEVTFLNDSDQDIVLRRGVGLELDSVFPDESVVLRTLAPGDSIIRRFEAFDVRDDGSHCEANAVVYWILESADKLIFNGADSVSVTSTDFVVLDVIGPEICWDTKKDDTVTYAG